MKQKLPTIARSILGLLFLVSGILGFFFKPPSDLPENLKAFNDGMAASTYFMPFLKGTEAVCGLLLLSGYFVPLALVILAPISIHIFLVHVFLDPKGIPVAVVVGLLISYLSFFAQPYSEKIKALFVAK